MASHSLLLSGNWPTRSTHIYLGLWVLTIKTPSKGGKVRKDLQ